MNFENKIVTIKPVDSKTNYRFQMNLDSLMSTRLVIIFYVLVNEYNSSQEQ